MKEGKRMEREGGENKIRKINKLQDGIARSKNVNLRPLHKRKRERKKKKKKRKKRIQNSNILVSLFFSFLVFCQLFIYSFFFFCLFCLVFSFVLIRIQQLYLKKKKTPKKTPTKQSNIYTKVVSCGSRELPLTFRMPFMVTVGTSRG